MSKIIVDFWQTFTAGFPKLQSTCPEKFFEKKFEKRRFLTSFVLWLKKFGTWANNVRQGLPKVHSACPGELLEKIKKSEKRMVSQYLSYLEGKFVVLWAKDFLNLWQNKLRCVFQNFILRVQGTFLRKSTFWKWWFYCNFSALSEQIWSFEGKILWRLTSNLLYGFRNRNLGVQWNKLRSFFGEKLSFFNLLSTLTKLFLVFGKKLSPRGVKTAFGESRSRLWGFFLKKRLWFSEIFAPWAESFRTLSKKIQSRVLRFTF